MSPFERTSQQQVPHRRLEEQPREVQMGEEAQAEELNLEFVQQFFSQMFDNVSLSTPSS